MGRFKKKKFIESVDIKLVSDDPDRKDQNFNVKMERGESYKVTTLGGDLIIYDADGCVRRHCDWQAGYTVLYTFNQKPLEWYDDADGKK